MNEVLRTFDFDFDEDGAFRTKEEGKPVIYLQLNDGRVAKVVKGKGKHARTASMMAGKDITKMQPAMCVLCTEINGAKIALEDFDEMDLGDYLRIQGAFNELNFLSVPQT